MVGGAPVARTHTSDIWAFDNDFTRGAIVRPDGALDVYNLSSTLRIITRIPANANIASRPSALAVAPQLATWSPFVVSATHGGHILGADRLLVQLESSITALQVSNDMVVACDSSSKNVAIVDVVNGAITKRHSVTSEHVGKLSSLCVSSDSRKFAVCSQTITIHDVASGKCVQTLTGHASPISAAAFFSADNRLITGSKDEPHIFIWDVREEVDDENEAGKKKRKRRRKSMAQLVAHTLIAPESGVRQIEIQEHRGDRFCIAALMKSGVVALWRDWKADVETKTSKPDFIIHPCTEDTSQGAANVHGIGFQSGKALHVLYGSNLRPQLFAVPLSSTKNKLYLPKPALENLLVNHSTALKDGQVAGIGSGTVAAARDEANASQAIGKTPMEHAPAEGSTRRRKRTSADANLTGEEAEEKANASASDDDDNDDATDPQLVEKLASLGVSADAVRGMNKKKSGESGLQEALRDDANSKAAALLQALKSTDDKLLNSIICVKQPARVITNTVRKLPPKTAVSQLLRAIDDKLRNSPRMTSYLVPWVKEIIVEHNNSLGSPNLNPYITSISQHVKLRVELSNPLIRLQGRLELVNRRAQRSRTLQQNSVANAKPQLEYVEKHIDEDVIEEEEEDDDDDDDSSEESEEVVGSDDAKDGGEDEGEDEDSESEEDSSSEEDDKTAAENGRPEKGSQENGRIGDKGDSE